MATCLIDKRFKVGRYSVVTVYYSVLFQKEPLKFKSTYPKSYDWGLREILHVYRLFSFYIEADRQC
jgi:hypothetical protein